MSSVNVWNPPGGTIPYDIIINDVIPHRMVDTVYMADGEGNTMAVRVWDGLQVYTVYSQTFAGENFHFWQFTKVFTIESF